MSDSYYVGWDIGGAHLKVAVLDASGIVVFVNQYDTPIWLGLKHLEQAFKQCITDIEGLLNQNDVFHGVTMTAELSDHFFSREQGVMAIVNLIDNISFFKQQYYYSIKHSFVLNKDVKSNYLSIASANWHCTATFAAQYINQGILVDFGSTTTDIIPFKKQRVLGSAITDHDRLCSGELLYTGMKRTPVMAVVDQVVYKGNRVQVMAEKFATMADVYRIIGKLSENAGDTTADNRSDSILNSMVRLRRMIGLDQIDDKQSEINTIDMAKQIHNHQIAKIKQSFINIKSHYFNNENFTLLAAGCGSELLEPIADSCSVRYKLFNEVFEYETSLTGDIQSCISAVAVAGLLRMKHGY